MSVRKHIYNFLLFHACYATYDSMIRVQIHKPRVTQYPQALALTNLSRLR